MISILIGNDTYAIEREVEKFKTQTHPYRRSSETFIVANVVVVVRLNSASSRHLSLFQKRQKIVGTYLDKRQGWI